MEECILNSLEINNMDRIYINLDNRYNLAKKSLDFNNNLHSLKEFITDEMQDYFLERTHKHINLYCDKTKILSKIVDAGFDGNVLVDFSNSHDFSKFENPELYPYILITWKYKLKFLNKENELKLPDFANDLMAYATLHHIKTNTHHPEFYDDNIQLENYKEYSFNNRDNSNMTACYSKPMPTQNIAEMVCDWCAVGEERNTNPIEWANANVNKRWLFTSNQINSIYKYLRDILNYGKQ